MKKFEFDAKCFRMLPCPYSDADVTGMPVTYEAYVEIQDLPSDFPMKTNPREQNLNTKVSKTIRESVNTLDETFHIKNRGIVLSAKSVNYDQKSKKYLFIWMMRMFTVILTEVTVIESFLKKEKRSKKSNM